VLGLIGYMNANRFTIFRSLMLLRQLSLHAGLIDRTHRIGQTHNVMVYRLVAKDTIEEKVMALKARKAELFSSVLDEGNVFGSALDADDIRGLFA
jgi:SNF2 family DNA or RNA helicase